MNETKKLYGLSVEGGAEKCRAYVDRGKPQKSDEDKALYEFCCEENFFCSVWVQPWFWITIGCVILAIIALCVFLCVFCCCCRGRLCGGVDQMKETFSEEIENQGGVGEDSEDSSESSSSDSDLFVDANELHRTFFPEDTVLWEETILNEEKEFTMSHQNAVFPYDSLKSVMTFLDPLMRLKLSRQCPSLQNLTNLLPLKIQYLRIASTEFQVNTTTYKIGIIKKCNDGRTPESIEEENSRGGLQYDTDRYGRRLNEEHAVPSDLSIEDQERRLDYPRRLRSRRAANGWQDRKLEEQILEGEVRIETMKAIKDNMEPPFKLYVKLRIEHPNRAPKMEYLMYNKTLQEFNDSCFLKIFGTHCPIHVKHLDVRTGGHCLPREMDEIPHFLQEAIVGMMANMADLKSPYFPFESKRMTVRKLDIYYNTQCGLNAIRSIMEETPLKMLTICGLPNIPEDPIIQNTEFLKITRNPEVDILRRFSNERVHLEECKFTEENVTVLVEHWKQRASQIGSHYSIGFKNGEDVEKCLNLFKGLPEAKQGELEETRSSPFPGCTILPIRDFSELNIYCEQTKHEDWYFCKTEWIVRIKLQPKGFGDNLLLD